MKKISPMLVLAALVLGLCALSACGGSSSSPAVVSTASAAPTVAPTATASPVATAGPTSSAFTATFVSIPFLPSAVGTVATQVNFPSVGNSFVVTVQINGGVAPFTATQSNTGITCASVGTAAGTNNQFIITPTGVCGPSQITFTDSSPTKQSTLLTYYVGGSLSGGITGKDRSVGQ
jgi:hypothetical protein